MNRTLWKFGFLLALVAFTLTLNAQQTPPQGPPPAPQNLKVLPKDMPRQQLIGIMGNWSRALGVKCDHCHAEDKASDDKPEKDVARAMVRMMINLRQNANEFLPDNRIAKVSCWTCHRGSAKIEVPAPPAPPPGQGAQPKPPQQQ